jgi:ATP-dependent Lhr-like helicase
MACISIDDKRRVIEVVPAHGVRAPQFSGGGGAVHRAHTRGDEALYTTGDYPAYLDSEASKLLIEGRDQFAIHMLASRSIIQNEGGCLLFLWAGDTIANTVLVQLRSLGLTRPHAGGNHTGQTCS